MPTDTTPAPLDINNDDDEDVDDSCEGSEDEELTVWCDGEWARYDHVPYVSGGTRLFNMPPTITYSSPVLIQYTFRRELCSIRCTGGPVHKYPCGFYRLLLLSPNQDFWRRKRGESRIPQLRNTTTPATGNQCQRHRRRDSL